MRKYLPFLGIILFPYLIVFTLICIFIGSGSSSMETISYAFLLILPVLYVVALVCAVVVFIKGITNKKKSLEILRINMIIKLIHIPAYLIIFVLGLLSTITIFTIGLAIVLLVLDLLTIAVSGLIGLGGVIGSLRENKISIKKAVIYGILQFMYCADVISSILIYRTVKATE